MESKVKWLLVGPGDIAQKRVAPGLAAAENSEIVGIVYEAPREQAQALADQYGGPQIFNDLGEALSSRSAGVSSGPGPAAGRWPTWDRRCSTC